MRDRRPRPGTPCRRKRSRQASRRSGPRPRRGRSRWTPEDLRSEPAAGGQEAGAADALPRAVQQRPRLRPAHRRLHQTDAEPVARRVDHLRGRHPQFGCSASFRRAGRRRRSIRSATCSRRKRAPLRDGETRLIPAEDLVPGDIVLLESGDNIPADLRLDRRQEPAHRGGGADRRVGAGREDDRAGRREGDGRRSREHGLLRHDGRLRAARPALSSRPEARRSLAASTSCSPK